MDKSQISSDTESRTRHSAQSESEKQKKRKKDNRIRKCNFQWTLEATMTLIENVKNFENLWDPNNDSYKDRKIHQKSWESIAKSLSLPKQEVVVKWNSLRSNYRLFVKNHRNNSGRYCRQRGPRTFFLAMGFLDPILNLDTKPTDLNSTNNEYSKNTLSEDNSCSSSVFKDFDEEIDISGAVETNIVEIKEETSSLVSDENMPSISQEDYNHLTQYESRKRKISNGHNEYNSQEEPEEDIETLQKRKLQLEIYNLQLDAVKKEIELGLERSQFTAELYENWDVPMREEI